MTLITEFAAISLALGALGISPYLSVPVAAFGLTLMVVKGSYQIFVTEPFYLNIAMVKRIVHAVLTPDENASIGLHGC